MVTPQRRSTDHHKQSVLVKKRAEVNISFGDGDASLLGNSGIITGEQVFKKNKALFINKSPQRPDYLQPRTPEAAEVAERFEKELNKSRGNEVLTRF